MAATAASATLPWAHADVGPRELVDTNGWCLPGLTVGLLSGDSSGAALGGELSCVALFGARGASPYQWIGAYVDGQWETSHGAGQFSVGPEVGWTFLGVDGGYALRRDEGTSQSGVAVRVVVTIGYAAIFGRWSAYGDETNVGEFGLQLKLPIRISGDGAPSLLNL